MSTIEKAKHNGGGNPPPSYIAVMKAAAKALCNEYRQQEAERQRHEPFASRGFSEKTINALIERGITYPEQLLFLSEADVKALNKQMRLPKARFDEIKAYILLFRDVEALA